MLGTRSIWTSFIKLAPIPLIVLAGLAIVLWPSILRLETYNSAMLDLGNMSQSIWSSTQGSPLMYTSADGPKSRLAGPMELIFFVIGPIYAIFPDPRTLLIIQGLVFAAGVFPIYRLSSRKLGDRKLALGVCAIYVTYPVAQTAVLFDFHGDTLAMVFLLFAIEALDRQAGTAFLIWSLLAMASKFYVALALLLILAAMWFSRRRQLAGRGVLVALGWLALTVMLQQHFSQSNPVQSEVSGFSRYAAYYFGQLEEFPKTIGPRIANAVIVFAPALLLAFRSPFWLIAGAAMASPALLSTGPGPAYSYAFHHYALVVPFLMVAIIEGAASIPYEYAENRKTNRWNRPRSIAAAFGISLIFSISFVQTPLSPSFYLSEFPGRMDRPWGGRTSRDKLIDEWLDKSVPGQVPIAADVFLAPHVSNRAVLYPLYRTDKNEPIRGDQLTEAFTEVDFVVFDLFSELLNVEALQYSLQDGELRLLDGRDGLLLFGREPSGLTYNAEIIDRSGLANGSVSSLSEGIGVAGYEADMGTDGRLNLVIDWILTTTDNSAIVISELAGVPNSRIVHFPMLLQLSTGDLKSGSLIRETIEVPIPQEAIDLGSDLVLRLYKLEHPSIRQAYESGPIGYSLTLNVFN